MVGLENYSSFWEFCSRKNFLGGLWSHHFSPTFGVNLWDIILYPEWGISPTRGVGFFGGQTGESGENPPKCN